MIKIQIILLALFVNLQVYHVNAQKTVANQQKDSLTEKSNLYGPERIEQDAELLTQLTREMTELANELAVTKRTLSFKDNPYLNQQENKDIGLLLFRFMAVRDSLWEMVLYYRGHSGVDPDTHTRGAILGMSAGLHIYDSSSYFAALFHQHKDLIRILNTARPSYTVPKGFYNALSGNVTSIENLELIDIVWYLFCKELTTPDSLLFAVNQSDPHSQQLIQQMDGLRASAHIQVEYILHSNWSSMPDLHNRLRHSRIANLGDQMANQMGDNLYKTRGFVFKNVARLKDPSTRPLQFSETQVRQLKSILQPGDILLTYTAGYMSNVFLPGNFKHGITYIGTVEERRAAGLTDALLTQRAVSIPQAQHLIENVQQTTLPDGHPINIIEAVSEGVILNSLDELLETHINRLVILRPKTTSAETLDQLVTLFQYVDTPYDFKFDFQNDTYQCCTELIYRTLNRQGSIDFSLIKMRGQWILAADDILRYALKQNPEAFDFVLFAEADPEASDRSALLQPGSDGLQTLKTLMGISR